MRLPTRYIVFSLPEPRLTRRLVVQPPPGWPKRPYPASVLQFLNGKRWRRTAAEAEAALERRVENIARILPWPRLAMICEDSQPDDPVLADPLVWCVAASKQTGDIVLLDKKPNLDRLFREENRLVLRFVERRCLS